MAVVPTFIIAGETAGRRYEQGNWRVTPLFPVGGPEALITQRAQGKGKSGSSGAHSPAI